MNPTLRSFVTLLTSPRAIFSALGFRPSGLTAAALLLAACLSPHLALAALRPVDLRCEYLKDPLGIDTPQPRLSWVLQAENASAHGRRQTAYEILVATSPSALQAGQGDLWHSGAVQSDQSIQLPYQGKPLASEQECFWKVRVWDQEGRLSRWSEPARWTMGLLAASDWKAKWIGLDEAGPKATLTGASWIWFPEGQPETAAPIATRFFRRVFDLPRGRTVKSARWLVAADNQFTAFVNGKQAGTGDNFKAATSLDVTALLQPGRNLLAASVKNVGDNPNPAGLLALLEIDFEAGEPVRIATDETWRSSAEELPGWQQPAAKASTWLAARNLGPAGMQPWGEISGPEDRRLPARWLRKEFATDKQLRRATAYISGLGLSELYLNGRKAGDHVLSPGLTEYPKRAFYVTHDVTALIQRGANAVGVVLGNGRYFAPRSKVPTETRTYGFPKLLLQLKLEYADGSSALVLSDDTWKLTTNGPVRANNEYDGEIYDARLEMPGWNQAGFDASRWQQAMLVSGANGAPAEMRVGSDVAQAGSFFLCTNLAAQMISPIRVTQTLKPVAITFPKVGVCIFDLGQNMVGWCRLRVRGPRGATVSLRHAETLKPDGTLYLDNIRSAQVTDTYTLKGGATEVYEPRFTYHGFRFVEVTGFPGMPGLNDLEGRVVNDDLESAGEFSCSEPLVNRIYQNIRWGVRGNYRSLPTDCPQRDERQGWLGDRSAESKGETYLFHTAALYSKWLQDMADAQKESGSVPDVCPSYWPIYSDNVTWPSSTVIIPSALREQFGDLRVIEQHYDSAKKWMDYMGSFVTNGIIERDSYGDWCVPPENPKLIHSEDPQRKTNKGLLATAYFYHDALWMVQYARQLGKTEDAQRFTTLADDLKAAFNRTFWKADTGQYDNGSQTSCVLPLAFGLVPEAQRQQVFSHLVNKIRDESLGHIGTGLIGGQWLLRVLSDNGRPDLAWQIATQRAYPSWGYMVEQGATTIWELWNGNTADPAMNSGNHVMLVGDLCTWLHEYLAGIRPDPAQPGFRHILLKPEPVGQLRHARATHHSPFGLIASDWRITPKQFAWDVTVPVNTTATICVPVGEADAIKIGGTVARHARGVTFVKTEDGRSVFEAGSGKYQITAPWPPTR
jgi:alpha-L-rhamnosidase